MRMESDIAERIAAKSDAELLQMLGRDAAQYRPDVLEIANREATRRGLSLDDVVDAEPADDAKPSPTNLVYYAAGRPIACAHCSGTRFQERRALLNSRALTFLDLDFLDNTAVVLTCTTCQRMEWFAAVESRPE